MMGSRKSDEASERPLPSSSRPGPAGKGGRTGTSERSQHPPAGRLPHLQGIPKSTPKRSTKRILKQFKKILISVMKLWNFPQTYLLPSQLKILFIQEYKSAYAWFIS